MRSSRYPQFVGVVAGSRGSSPLTGPRPQCRFLLTGSGCAQLRNASSFVTDRAAASWRQQSPHAAAAHDERLSQPVGQVTRSGPAETGQSRRHADTDTAVRGKRSVSNRDGGSVTTRPVTDPGGYSEMPRSRPLLLVLAIEVYFSVELTNLFKLA